MKKPQIALRQFVDIQEDRIEERAHRIFSNLIVRRWLDLLLFMACVGFLFPVLHTPLIKLATAWSSFVVGWPPVVLYFIIFLCSLFTSIILLRLGALFPYGSLSTMIKYPPIWLVSMAGFFVFVLCCAVTHHIFILHLLYKYSIELLLTFNASLAGVIIVLWGAKIDNHKCPESNKQKLSYECADGHQQKSLAPPELRLLDWVNNESPINNSLEDRFSHDIQATRIVSLLLQNAPASIGVVGPFGSGKSCLIKLIEDGLSNSQQIIICKIDGWGRASGSIAHQILAMAIAKVRQHIDCLSILTLPENYRQAIGVVKAPAGAILAALLQVSHDPIAQLKKLDQLLEVADRRLVIILEDLDRNVSEEVLNEEIPALLDRLHKLSRVTFILAIGTEKKYSSILVRICDYMESVA